MTVLAIIHKQEIIQGLLDGKRLSDIAKKLGCTHQALSAPLQNDPDYKAAMDASLDVRMDQREDELEEAQDQLAVARARELLSHARFRAERLAPQRWGKAESNQQVNVNLNLSNSTLSRLSDLIPDAVQSTSVQIEDKG